VRVVGQSDVDRMLGFEKAKDVLGCNDVACATEVAGALGVDSLVYGSVGKLGTATVLSLSWVDRETTQVLGRQSETLQGSPEQLIAALDRAVPKLLGKTPKEPTVVAPVAPVAPAAPGTPAPPPKIVVAPPAPPKVPARPPTETSAPGNLALNTGTAGPPHALESDQGWGGGAQPLDLTDGRRTYGSEWARGLAFKGGAAGYAGGCGWRQATVDLGGRRRFGRVVIWHHGENQAPDRCRLESWDGFAWVVILDSGECRRHLPYVAAKPTEWWQSWSTPMLFDFTRVEGSKVRFSFDNCGREHGWIYELEVYDPAER
jgi:hypothetical protein